MDENLFDELSGTAAEGLRKAGAARTADDREAGVAMAVRAATRLWSQMHDRLDEQSWGPVSALIQDHWSEIVALQHGSSGLFDHVSSAPGVEGFAGGSEISGLCGRLIAEPLFGARELVHSNLLAWFIDAEPAVAAVFAAWGSESERPGRRTEREKYHFDLIVHPEGRAPIVVENKTFSDVDEAQLDRYTPQAIKQLGPDARMVLLSLGDPGWEDDLRIFGDQEDPFARCAWRRRSYGELAAALTLAAEHVTGQDGVYRSEFLRRYAALLGTLHELAEKVADVRLEDQLELPSGWVEDLDAARVRSGYMKLRSQALTRLLNSHGPAGVTSGVTRGVPLLERFDTVPATGDRIGWQLQGRQFRLAVRVASTDNGYGRSAEDRQRREQYVEQRYGAFFDLDALGTTTPAQARQEGWRAFSPDFVYRYQTLPEDTTIRDLVRLSSTAAELASSRLTVA